MLTLNELSSSAGAYSVPSRCSGIIMATATTQATLISSTSQRALSVIGTEFEKKWLTLTNPRSHASPKRLSSLKRGGPPCRNQRDASMGVSVNDISIENSVAATTVKP